MVYPQWFTHYATLCNTRIYDFSSGLHITYFSAVSHIFKCLVFQAKNLVFRSKSLLKSKPLKYTKFFLISNARMKLAKNQPNAKQHPEAELLLLQNYSHSLFPLSFKKKNKKQKKTTYSKKIS